MAPKGNKNAVGHGRTPNPGFSDQELLQIGKDLLAWCKKMDSPPDKKEENRKEVVHLSEFYSEIKDIPYSQWKSMSQRSCFFPYYEKAREWMGKRILRNKDMPSAYGCRFIGVYFREVAEHEREIIEHKIDYEISKKEAASMRVGSYPNDDSIANLLSGVKAKEVIEQQALKIKELEEKINGLESKANQVDQSG